MYAMAVIIGLYILTWDYLGMEGLKETKHVNVMEVSYCAMVWCIVYQMFLFFSFL